MLTKSPCPAGFPGKEMALERLSGPFPTLPTAAGPRPRLALSSPPPSPAPGSTTDSSCAAGAPSLELRASGGWGGGGLRPSVPRPSIQPPICCGASHTDSYCISDPPCVPVSYRLWLPFMSLCLWSCCASVSLTLPRSLSPLLLLWVSLCCSVSLQVSVSLSFPLSSHPV